MRLSSKSIASLGPAARHQIAAVGAEPKRSKYGNRKTAVDGIAFDSAAEARHYGVLKLRERAGQISKLELQPVFPIEINGVLICHYRADFSWVERATGARVIADVKGKKTPVYMLKRKLMLAVWGIKIFEVKA